MTEVQRKPKSINYIFRLAKHQANQSDHEPAFMIMTVRKPFQLLLLCLVVLALYYVTIFSEFCLLDDRDVILGLSNIEHFDLVTIFFPNSASGGYYRPLIGVFYLVDRFVWGLEPRILHFENIVFHLVNVVLFFLISTELMKKEVNKPRFLPLLAALFFAAHPIATESVNWISGRTDLLSGIFLLLATLILIRFREQRFWYYWLAIYFCVLIGVLAKETAIAFIFVAFFLLNMKNEIGGWKNNASGSDSLKGIALLTVGFYVAAALAALFLYNYFLVLLIVAGYAVALYWRDIGTSRRDYLKLWFGMSVSLLLAVLLYFSVRKLVFISDIARIPHTLLLIKADAIYAFKVFTGAIGFYVKKFFFPFPLNFAIREIDPLYELVGIGVLLLTVLFFRIGGVVSSLTLAGLCLIAPALPLSLGTIAWTAYAERYIYLAIPFWLLAAAIGWNRVAADRVRVHHAGAIVAVVLLVFFMKGTFERNLIWRTNLSLFKDTVQQSPYFKVPRGLYMLALFENNRYDEALAQYRFSSSLPTLEYDEKFDILYALICIRKGHLEEAKSTFQKVLRKKETISVLENFLKLLTSMHGQFASNDPRRQEVDRLVSYLYDRLNKVSGDALYLYRLGQFYLNNAKRDEAKICFARAARELPESSKYKQYARNLLTKLQ